MVVYDQIPLSKTEFSCEQKIWSEKKVENDFKEIVNRNINAVNLRDTYSKKYFTLDTDAQDIQATFSYNEDWPFYMEVY